MEQANQTI